MSFKEPTVIDQTTEKEDTFEFSNAHHYTSSISRAYMRDRGVNGPHDVRNVLCMDIFRVCSVSKMSSLLESCKIR